MSGDTFEITSGAIRITDPCYENGTWCAGTVKAKNGTWRGSVEIDDSSGRVAELHARLIGSSSHPMVKVPFDVGVDSGQAGVFDEGYYDGHNAQGEADDPTSFYGRACMQTCWDFTLTGEAREKRDAEQELPWEERTKELWTTPDEWESYGVVDGQGFVSSTGYGDGSYDAYVENDENGLAVAVKIVYIPACESCEERDCGGNDCWSCNQCGDTFRYRTDSYIHEIGVICERCHDEDTCDDEECVEKRENGEDDKE